METKKSCHCNGSRGTDCDWCQGTGWKTPSIKILGITKADSTTNNNQKHTNLPNTKEKKKGRLKVLEAKLNNASMLTSQKEIQFLSTEMKKIRKFLKDSKRGCGKNHSDLFEIIERIEKKWKALHLERHIYFSRAKWSIKATKNKQYIGKDVSKEKRLKTKKVVTKVVENKSRINGATLNTKFKDQFDRIRENLQLGKQAVLQEGHKNESASKP